MSDAECGAICVRKDVMDKFNIIMQDTKLDANELMEHLFNLHSCQGEVKTENQDFIPVGMTYNPGGNNLNHSTNNSKNSSMSEGDDVTCLGVTNLEDKVHLLQKLREQAGTSHYNNHQSGGMFQNYNSFTGSGMAPPTMVAIGNSGQGDLLSPPKKKKKGSKRPKLSTPTGQPILVSDGEDLLKSSMCSLCQATFARFTDLLAHHKEVHNSDTNHPLRCRACGRTQTSEAGLIYHQVYVCKMVERPHQCHICGLKFQSEEMVLVHKCSGCPRKKYACEFCDHYRTESSSDLEKHMRIHTNDKCYVCKVCGFSTAWKKNLKEHMVKHLGLKPYVCDLCGYSTSDRHNLRSHRMKHYQKGEGCEKCGGMCRCNQLPLSGKKKKKIQGGLGDSANNSIAGALSSMKELECPYPQCVYRTKIEYMMSNHMLRHQGMGDQNIPNANTHNAAITTNTAARSGVANANTINNNSSAGTGTAVTGNTGNNNNNNGNNSNNNNNNNTNNNNVSGNFPTSVQSNVDSSKNGQHRSQGLLPPGNNNNGGNKGQYAGANAAAANASSPATSSISPSTTITQSSSLASNQNIPPTLISSANQMPLEWKNIGQPAPPTVFSPPAHFSPLVHHQQGHLQPQAMNSSALSSWASPLSPTAVPPGLLTNRVSVAMTGQNMVARPMPVFPNMPN